VKQIFAVDQVSKTFDIRTGITRRKVGEVRAVDNVSFGVGQGEALGIIGETGSGKTTIAKMLLLLLKPDHGKILFEDRDVSTFSKTDVKEYRKRVQTVFQDPTSSLNPRQNVKGILESPLKIHGVERKNRIPELLKLVNLEESYIYRYPHTLSGGEKQRVAIARALALNPEVIILDEPTSALDVSVQAKIIALLKGFREKFNITYLFISHDLSLVANFCDRTLVVYNGKMCEMGKTSEIFANPIHPYTEMLLSSVPVVSESEEKMKPKDVPVLTATKSVRYTDGCVFRDKCWLRQGVCETKVPEFREVSSGHWVACHVR
jgi:oligopeptide/dipeptide ABC transporter ATP-binding protein